MSCSKLLTSYAAQHGKAIAFVLGALATIVALFALYTWASLTWNYSDGERAGYVQKFSRKGWVCKTWEGDLAMVNLPGQPAELFSFSVRDAAVAAQLESVMGKRASLHYDQHRGVPSTCFGETEYFVTSVRVVDEK